MAKPSYRVPPLLGLGFEGYVPNPTVSRVSELGLLSISCSSELGNSHTQPSYCLPAYVSSVRKPIFVHILGSLKTWMLETFPILHIPSILIISQSISRLDHPHDARLPLASERKSPLGKQTPFRILTHSAAGSSNTLATILVGGLIKTIQLSKAKSPHFFIPCHNIPSFPMNFSICF